MFPSENDHNHLKPEHAKLHNTDDRNQIKINRPLISRNSARKASLSIYQTITANAESFPGQMSGALCALLIKLCKL